ncbi:MAG TPA: AI-2E family transporter [Pyrinomonadaceae bacterium]|nr:AI-2E family transporter [Pyrinomonadaceae bacterium]
MSKTTRRETDKEPAARTVEISGPPNRVVFRIAFIAVAVVAGAFVIKWVIERLSGIILLLVLSIFFAYLVAPLVEFLRRPRTLGSRTVAMPRALAIAVAYVTIAVVVVVAVYAVLPSLTNQYPEFANQAREYWASLGERSKSVIEYSRSGRIPPRVVEEINNAVPKVVEKVSTVATEFATLTLAYLVLYIPWIILIPILAFFLLKDADSFRRSALLMLPRGRWRWRGDEFFQDVNNTLAAYIRAQLTACLFIGVVCAIGFTLLGLPGGLVMGVIAGVFEFVPLVGPVTVALMAAILAMLHAGPFNAFLVLLFLGVLRIVQDYAIYPRLIGQGIHLHPLAVIFAILAGEKLGGVPGVFLAIPLVAILTVSYRHWLEHYGNEGFADLLEPTPTVAVVETTTTPAPVPEEELHHETTPEQMVRVRPDLTTGELKMPVEE